MIFNILFIIISTIVLYRKRIAHCKDIENNPDKPNEPNLSTYNKYLYFTITSQCIINIITNIIVCTNNSFSEVGYVILYTLITWFTFAIIVTFKQYLRIPISNIFGYLWYYKVLSKALKKNSFLDVLKTISGNDDLSKLKEFVPTVESITTNSTSNLDIFNESTSLIIDEYTKKLIYVDKEKVDNENKDIIVTIPYFQDGFNKNTQCFDIIKACCKRDMFGELILFVLAGIMCVFMAEYILTMNTCKK